MVVYCNEYPMGALMTLKCLHFSEFAGFLFFTSLDRSGLGSSGIQLSKILQNALLYISVYLLVFTSVSP